VSFLVDTNVFSEPARPKPVAGVVEWLRANEAEIYVSTITVAEIRRGIERLPGGKRQTNLRAFLQSLGDCMKGRVLGFTLSTAHVWGQLKAGWDRAGIAVSSMDGLIAATAHRHQLTLVTRNAGDFEKTGVRLLNPFGDTR
jgi:toxin FitB